MNQLRQKHVVLPNAIDGLTPIELYLLSDGRLVFVPTRDMTTTSEYQVDGVSSLFHSEGFDLWEPGSKVYSYHYNEAYLYKQMPLMRGWLVQQDLSKGN